MHKKIYLLVFFLGLIFAQHTHDHDNYIRCAADELEQELQLTNPEFIAKRDAEILKAQELIKENPQWRIDNRSQNTIYIPVIFHVLYATSSGNLSASQIGANFDQINLDFSNTNPDGDEIPSAPNPSNAPNDPGIDYSHQSVRGTHNVQFVGAQGELTGNTLVEGVTIRRYQISQSTVSGVGEASNLASSTPTDSGAAGGYQDGYLNIYIAPLTGGLLGQAYLGFPESVVLTGSVGSVQSPGTAGNYSRGRTLTHELGHNFTFNHTFNSGNCGQSLWNDIPAQTQNNRTANIYEWPAGSGNFYGRGGVNSCIGTTGKGDQFMNYMDYVYDNQMRMFSEQQALDGYAWAASRNWAEVVNGVSTVVSSPTTYATSDNGFTVNLSFSEVVTGFTQDDIILTNAIVSSFNGGDGKSYNFDVEAIDDGNVTVQIAQNCCVGTVSGYDNFASNELSVLVDRTKPITGTVTIGNIRDSQYITKSPNVNLVLSDFSDETSGLSLYFVSVGQSPGGDQILPYQPYQSEYIGLSNLSLNNYQQYFVNVYAQDLVGLNSNVVSIPFYYFGSLIGDSNNDWIIDFQDYVAFMADFPGIDIAPVTGSAPYFFPNFDGISDAQDIAMFESMWNWSLVENGRTEPNYTQIGQTPYLRIMNKEMMIRFPAGTTTSQIYFEYDPDGYNIDYKSSNLFSSSILNANDPDKGIIQIEVADYNSESSNGISLTFDFENNTNSYEFMRVSYAAYSKENVAIAEGYNLIQTAPSTYRLAQSYPNPFSSGGTTIEFDMPQSDRITMVILDIRGRVVRTLINNEARFGYQSITWDAKNDDGDEVSSGVYFYQVKSGNFNDVGKLVFIK